MSQSSIVGNNGKEGVSPLDDSLLDLELVAYERWISKQWNFRLKIKNYVVLNLNPVVTVISFIVIAGFVIWCIVDEGATEQLADVKKWIKDLFTWLYIVTQNIWFIFLIVLLFTPYAKIKLGRPEDKPDFGYVTWFMMLFAAGLGIGLIFYGVAEPIFHYEPCGADPPAGPGSDCYGNRYSQLPDNQRAQWAINLAYYHWGFYGWVVYIVVAVLLGYVTYKEGLPLTMKSTFYPLIGDKIFGWMGDVIDIISVATTMFGVSTSLGLGVKQINAGLSRLNSDIPDSINSQVVITWIITSIATLSVVSGVKLGIRRLSEITFLLGSILMLAVFFMDDSWYLLNLLVQSIGFYWQWFPQLSFHTDAFYQLYGSEAQKNWMESWTIFYWGWWIAWSPFVGMFIAKISKGRTIADIIIGGLIAPTCYSFIWFAVFGGAGLRLERDAATIYNITNPNNPSVELSDGTTITRLAFQGTTDMMFDLYERYHLSEFWSVLTIAALILYFVTSSDSGSLVIDILSANGHPEPPTIQRIFWALLEGASATALIKAGGDSGQGLTALQTVSVIAGLPYTILLCLMCQALWIAMRVDSGHITVEGTAFKQNLFDPITEYTFNLADFCRVLLAVVAPWIEATKITAHVYGGPYWLHAIFQAATFYAWPVLLIANTWKAGLWVLGWVFYIVYVTVLACLRTTVRNQHGLLGDPVTDFLVMLFMFPLGVVQMADQIFKRQSSQNKVFLKQEVELTNNS